MRPALERRKLSARLVDALDALVVRWPAWDRVVYAAFVSGCVLFAAASFYGYMLLQTHGRWSAPLDDVFIHFDYARATARGYPFQWSEGNGFSSGNTSLTYPFTLALGHLIGFRGTSLMIWAAMIACVSTFTFLMIAGALLDPIGRWAKYLVPPAVLSLGALDWTLFSGMENAFHLGLWSLMLLATLSIARSAREGDSVARAGWITGGIGAILFATRPESVISVAAFAFFAALAVLEVGAPSKGASFGDRMSALFRSSTRREALLTIVRVAAPGVVAVIAQAIANRAFTGEWAANGAIAKLTLNNPYMTAIEKWREYQFLLGYVIVRNTQHHFSDTTPWGWLVPILAAAPLAVRSLRRVAILLWVQALGWLALVAMNAQVRWQNERYTMAAVAWILVLAAMGLATIVTEIGRTKRDRILWGVRGAVAAGLAGLYWFHQAPNMRDQVWFFGRACRNIADQHIVAGRILAASDAHRVLVGDAGALMYASDKPGLDLIGLGGYHDLPFARAGVHGLGASLELVERIPEADRPDTMAIYPSWWGELPTLFGREITEVVVVGNVICGGAEKVLYRANWNALDRKGTPRTLAPHERVVDELDVADLVSERAHGYVFPHPSMGFVGFRVLADPADTHRDLFDAGREIPPDQVETARVSLSGKPSRLIVRTVGVARPSFVDVTIGGRVVGRLEIPRGRGWREPSIDLPIDVRGDVDIQLTPRAEGWTNFHVWVVEKAASSVAESTPP
jgi:hypothetical protein